MFVVFYDLNFSVLSFVCVCPCVCVRVCVCVCFFFFQSNQGIACLESSRQFITTPTAATFSSVFVDETNVCVVSILRAGDALAEAAHACIPTAPSGKVRSRGDTTGVSPGVFAVRIRISVRLVFRPGLGEGYTPEDLFVCVCVRTVH